MIYANPTDLHADINCWETLIWAAVAVAVAAAVAPLVEEEEEEEEGEEGEEEDEVKGEKSMMGIVELIFF